VDEIDVDRALGLAANMLHKWSSTLETGIQLARATPPPLTIEQRTTLRNVEEIVRRAGVAYLAILADRSRVLS
jgi:transposase-like protein